MIKEHYTEGRYAYLRYQVLKTPAGKLDLTFAIHSTKFELLTPKRENDKDKCKDKKII